MSIRDNPICMNTNPYESPLLVESKTDAERAAERRVAPVAMGLQFSGVLVSLMGVIGVAGLLFAAVMWWQLSVEYGEVRAPIETDEALWTCLVIVGAFLVGFLAFYAGRRLRRLDSTRWAYAACILVLVFYPMCLITLPLSIYGIFVLRREDVKAVIRHRETQRKAKHG